MAESIIQKAGAGADLDVVTAVAADILAGKVGIDQEGEPVAGAMADKSGAAQSATASLDTTSSRLQMAVPVTGKYSTSSKLYATYTAIRSLIGLTAASIAVGSTVLGLSGTYKGAGNASSADVRKGKTFSTASLSNAPGTMAEKSSAIYTPGKSNQIIAENQFLAGAQTILGDADLVAENIRSGKNIFGVAGTYNPLALSAGYLYSRGIWGNAPMKVYNSQSGVEFYNNRIHFSSRSKGLESINNISLSAYSTLRIVLRLNAGNVTTQTVKVYYNMSDSGIALSKAMALGAETIFDLNISGLTGTGTVGFQITNSNSSSGLDMDLLEMRLF